MSASARCRHIAVIFVTTKKLGAYFAMTPEQKIARQKRLVSAAKAMLTSQVGFYIGAVRVRNVLRTMGEELENQHGIFSKFLQTVPVDIPLGNARLLWEPSAMLKSDQKLLLVESKFRSEILAECVNIIKQYG
jgi:hypothetical protein